MLEKKELRQLSQRITARFHLDALDRADVESYINHRIEIAGGNPALFSRAAIRRVYRLSGGIPRLINLICDRALLGAYAESRLHIDADVIDHAAREIFGEQKAPSRSRPLVPIAAALLLGALSTLLVMQAPWDQRETTTATTPTTQERGESARPTEEPLAPVETGTGEPAEEPVVTANLIGDETTAPFRYDALIAVEGDETPTAALRRLLSTWQVPLPAETGDPCETATRFDLRCLSLLGSLRDITNLNRPAVIRLSIASIDHFVMLTGVDADSVTVTSGNGRYRLRREDLLKTWNGEFILLWRTPAAYRVVQRGDNGPIVEHLSRQLSLVSDGPVEDEFSAGLEDRLKRFQVSAGLRPDGIAGALTWIHLNQAIGINAPTIRQDSR
ncbi:MAG: peptidoglycan-binding protein [Gammaproteobacteria bacterium]|nr:peptidoglycan-binding protein [Gammaproteobacteria bacterium]